MRKLIKLFDVRPFRAFALRQFSDCPEPFGKTVDVVLAEFRDGLYLRGRRFDEASIQVLVENRNHERVPELSILTCFFTVSLLFLIVAELH